MLVIFFTTWISFAVLVRVGAGVEVGRTVVVVGVGGALVGGLEVGVGVCDTVVDGAGVPETVVVGVGVTTAPSTVTFDTPSAVDPGQ